MKISRSGFTIVELLIVIVVIAILATISMIAYNGLQARASIAAGKSFDAQLRHALSITSIAELNFNEGSGLSSADSSEQGNNATVNGSWVAGMEGGSAVQANNNGMGAYIANNIYFGNESFTITAWVNSSDIDSAQSRVLGKDFVGPGPGGYFWLNFGNGKPSIEARDSSGAYWSTNLATNTTVANVVGKWAHIAAVVDREKGVAFVYINGKLEKQSAPVTSAGVFGDATATGSFRIGYQGSAATTALDGVIDDVYIYKSSLSVARIEQLYEAGNYHFAQMKRIIP